MDATILKNQGVQETPLISTDEKFESPSLSKYALAAQEIINTRENLGRLDKPNLSGRVRGCCGDSIQIDLCLDGNLIIDARFQTDGCSATIACGGMITRMIKGKMLAEAFRLEPDALRKALGGLPQGHQHCANLAVNTLRMVILKGTSDDSVSELLGSNNQERDP